VRPAGIGHLEDPELASDLTVARDFDLGMTGPPLSIAMDFITSGMAEMIGGLVSAAIGCHRRCRRCGGCASSATATSRG
jgi:hypothetical protein